MGGGGKFCLCPTALRGRLVQYVFGLGMYLGWALFGVVILWVWSPCMFCVAVVAFMCSSVVCLVPCRGCISVDVLSRIPVCFYFVGACVVF